MGKRKLRAKLAEATADRAKAGVTLNDYAKQLNIAMDRLKAAAHKLATAQGMTRSAPAE